MVSSADALLCFYAQLSNAAKHTVVASRATVLGPIRRRYVWKGPRRPIADHHGFFSWISLRSVLR